MAKNFNDLGLGPKAKRVVNQDGSFNVKRIGLGWTTVNVYQDLVNMSWTKFIFLILSFLLFINLGFSLIYFLYGVDHFSGIVPSDPMNNFLGCLYFSFQTFTTVGYGNIYPASNLMNFLSSLEAVIGWMLFALTTGLLYGRFSKPRAKIMFSENILISPYQDGESLQFRIVNKRRSVIMNMTARVVISYVLDKKYRRYDSLELERSIVSVFPLNWTIVHPITKGSPLYGKSRKDLSDIDSEFIIVLRGYDETFSQEIHAMHSYHYNEIIWNAEFEPMYDTHTDPITLDLSKLSKYRQIN